MQRFVAVVLEPGKGVLCYGPFGSDREADHWLTRSDNRAFHYCEVLQLQAPPGTDAGHPCATPHVLAVGTFRAGFTVHGPFAGFDEAELHGEAFDGCVVPLPLQGPG
jgi:hypothetical protein